MRICFAQDGTRAPLRRRGAVGVWSVVTLAGLAGLAFFVINSERAQVRSMQSQRTAEAAALATARELVDDRLLSGDVEALQELVEEARCMACMTCAYNIVEGRPVPLHTSGKNTAGECVLFGKLDENQRKILCPDSLADLKNPLPDSIDTVRIIVGRRPFLREIPIRIAAATLDRNIQGFRPTKTMAIPMVPIAVLSDPSGANPASWEVQVEKGTTVQQMRLLRAGESSLPFPPTKPRLMQVFLRYSERTGVEGNLGTAASGADATNACLLQLGASSWQDLCRQITDGIALRHLEGYPEQSLLLSTKSPLASIGGFVLPPADSVGSSELLVKLNELKASKETRIWPLYRAYEPEITAAILNDFVAAKLVHIEHVEHEETGVRLLALTLQPSVLSTPTAVTTRKDPADEVSAHNPYLCQVRLLRRAVAVHSQSADDTLADPLPTP